MIVRRAFGLDAAELSRRQDDQEVFFSNTSM
jgi:hypothetical protein